MARLDLHAIPAKGRDGYVLDVQADLLSHIDTCTVVPLLPEDVTPKTISDLNPVFEVRGKRYVMLPRQLPAFRNGN